MANAENMMIEDGYSFRSLELRIPDGMWLVLNGCITDIAKNLKEFDKRMERIRVLYNSLMICALNDKVLDNEGMRKFNNDVIELMEEFERLKMSLLAWYHIYTIQMLLSIDRKKDKKNIEPSNN